MHVIEVTQPKEAGKGSAEESCFLMGVDEIIPLLPEERHDLKKHKNIQEYFRPRGPNLDLPHAGHPWDPVNRQSES